MRTRLLLLLAGLALLGGASAQSDIPCSYIIANNDTLFEVGRRYNLTLADVIDANPDLNESALIQPGQVVALPCSDGNATSGDSVLDLLARRNDTTILFQAVVAAGLEEALADPQLDATVFAPNNTAFESLLARVFPNATLDDLLSDKAALAEVLSYHVVPGEKLKASDLTNGLNLTTMLEGEFVQVFKPGNITRLATSSGQRVRVVGTDLEGGQAVVHITKGVLLPASYTEEVAQAAAACEHTVQQGDTLFALAQQYDTTVDALTQLNPSLADNPTLLPLGSTLVVSDSCEL